MLNIIWFIGWIITMIWMWHKKIRVDGHHINGQIHNLTYLLYAFAFVLWPLFIVMLYDKRITIKVLSLMGYNVEQDKNRRVF